MDKARAWWLMPASGMWSPSRRDQSFSTLSSTSIWTKRQRRCWWMRTSSCATRCTTVW
ncbi:hypothetical protein [Lysobacter gummosus]|uniref:hypothetical protein n=1 Tax=Lysobacter gummosus TaxID=262324 RepID=UPI0036457F05